MYEDAIDVIDEPMLDILSTLCPLL